ncbi:MULTISPECIES: multiheme c-type cytochrome [Photobacterium]|uniref:multiheme c-type cytochrome n=1 Tax=Photobacterium TaxID=657 RepID=UPI0020C4080A|nr:MULTISPECIES: multiheme c-type cytochrome [Photobacterium]
MKTMSYRHTPDVRGVRITIVQHMVLRMAMWMMNSLTQRMIWGLLLLPFVVLAQHPTGNEKWLHPHKPTSQAEIDAQMPFYPSRASTGGMDLKPEMFEDPQVCKGCHQEIYRQWSQSVMANSWDDPIYQALFKRASEATKGEIDNFCIACHSPIGMTSMKATSAMIGSDQTLPGVNCEVCHNISELSGHDNAAYVLTPNRAMHVKLGPRTDAESPYHKTEFSDLHTRSEFCSVCHNVTHPMNSTPIERTYDEWQESVYNEQGVQCQDCHMTPGPGTSDNPGKSAIMGKDRKHIYSHDFSGGNSTLLEYLGHSESAQLSRDMLRSAATIEFMNLPSHVIPGEPVTIKVKVTNTGAGHKLPTGFPEGREVWIDFSASHDKNRPLYRSGAVVNGETEAGTRNFKVWLGDKNGDIVDLNVWEVDRVLADNRIPPKGFAIVDYTFVVPEDSKGKLTLAASLKYWPFSQHLVDELLGAGKMKVDIVEMTAATTTLAVKNEPLPNLIAQDSHH